MESRVNRMQSTSKHKSKVIEKLLKNQNLCKALYYNHSDFLEFADIDPYILLEGDTRRIYPERYVPTSTSIKNSYITMELGNYGLTRNKYKNGYIYVYTLVHQDCEETDIGWLRSDYLISLIDQQLNQTRGVGVGRLQFYDSDKFKLNDNYNGRCNVYKFYEFN